MMNNKRNLTHEELLRNEKIYAKIDRHDIIVLKICSGKK
jgi:hypothetical protein